MADDDSSSDESIRDQGKGEPKKTTRQLAQERLARLSKPIIRTNKRQERDDLYTRASAAGFPPLTRPENLQRPRKSTSVVKMVKLKDIQEGDELDDVLEEAKTREMFKAMATESQSHVLLDPTTSQFLRVSERAIRDMAKNNPEGAAKHIKEFRRVIKSRAKRGSHSQIGHISRMRSSLSRKKEQEEMLARGRRRRRRTPIGDIPLFASVPFSRIKLRPSIPIEEKYVPKIKPADIARLKEIQKASIDKFYSKSGNKALDKETVKRAIKDAVSAITGTSGATSEAVRVQPRRRGKTVPNPFKLSESRRSRRASPPSVARTERGKERRKIKGQTKTKRFLSNEAKAAADKRRTDSLAKFYNLKNKMEGSAATPVTVPPRHKLSKFAKEAADKRRTDSLAKFYNLKKKMEESSATPVTQPHRQKMSKSAKDAADKRRTDSLAKFYNSKKKIEESSATPVTQPPRQKLSKSAKDAADKRRTDSLAKFYNLKKKIEESSATPVTQPPRQKLSKSAKDAADKRRIDSLAKFYKSKKRNEDASDTPEIKQPRQKLSKSAKDSADERMTDSFRAKFQNLKKKMQGSGEYRKELKDLIDKRISHIQNKKALQLDRFNEVLESLNKHRGNADYVPILKKISLYRKLPEFQEDGLVEDALAEAYIEDDYDEMETKFQYAENLVITLKVAIDDLLTEIREATRSKSKQKISTRLADSLAKFYNLKKKTEESSATPVTGPPRQKLSKSAKDAADKRRTDSLAKFYSSKNKKEKPEIKPQRQKVSESAKKRTKESVDKAIEKMMKSREPKPEIPKLKRKMFEPSASSKQRTEAAEKKAIEKRLRSLLPKVEPPRHRSKIVKPSDKSQQRVLEAEKKAIEKRLRALTPKVAPPRHKYKIVKPSDKSEQRVKDAEKKAIDKLKGIKATTEQEKKRSIQPIEILDAIARKQKESYQKHLDKMKRSKTPKITPSRKRSVNKSVDIVRKIIPAPPKFIKKPKLLASVDKTIKKAIIPLPVLEPTKFGKRQQESINKYINSRQDILEKKEAARLLESKLSRWAESKMKDISSESSMKSFQKTPKSRRIRATDPIRSFEERIIKRLFPPGIPREKLGLFQEKVSGYVKKTRKSRTKTGTAPGGPDGDPDDGSDSFDDGSSADRSDRGDRRDRQDEYGREFKDLVDKRIAHIQDEKALQLDRLNQIRETLKKHRGIADMHYYVPILKKVALYRKLPGFQEDGLVEDALAEAYVEDDYDEMEMKFQDAEILVITLKAAIDDLLPEIREATRSESRRAIQFIKNCRVRVQLKCASQKSSEKIDEVLERFQTFFMSQFERNRQINLKKFLTRADKNYKKIIRLMSKMETRSEGRKPATNQRLDGHCGDLQDAECSFLQDLLTIPLPSDSEIESEEEPQVVLPDIPLPEEVVVSTPVEEVVVVTPEEVIVVTPDDEVAVVVTPDDEVAAVVVTPDDEVAAVVVTPDDEVAVVITPDDEVAVVTPEEEDVFVIPEGFVVVQRRSRFRAGKRLMKRYRQNLQSIHELPDDTLLQIQYLELHDELYSFMKTVTAAMAERCHSVFTQKYHSYGVGMMTITSAALHPILLYLPKCLERVHQIENGLVTDFGLESEIMERYRLETMRLKRICFERLKTRTNFFLKYVYGVVISRNVMGHIIGIMELKELTVENHNATNLCREAMEKAKCFRAFFSEICQADRIKFVEKLHRVDELFRDILEEIMQHLS